MNLVILGDSETVEQYLMLCLMKIKGPQDMVTDIQTGLRSNFAFLEFFYNFRTRNIQSDLEINQQQIGL